MGIVPCLGLVPCLSLGLVHCCAIVIIAIVALVNAHRIEELFNIIKLFW